MTELLAMTCDACGEPMLPNVSTLDADGCLWICIDPRSPREVDVARGALTGAQAGRGPDPAVVIPP